MGRQNLHTHTVFDDGQNTPMEMAQAALDAGLTSLGFSAHSTIPYENDWCLTDETIPAYLAAIGETKAAFAGRLAVYNGIELDGLSTQDTSCFDYVIGSLHHIAVDGWTPTIDLSAESTRETLETYFRGNEKAMIEAYFAQYDEMARNPRVNIVGHLDLLCKFWETDGLFDPAGHDFLGCAKRAVMQLARTGKIFEVNTGAMCRGYRHEPYPS
ncbi:MAG: PHP domain-containing protein, partial [Oscillospiraceae bacterium]|nr:PHP domain-containing protein [Oscillospiraceae bacterium]